MPTNPEQYLFLASTGRSGTTITRRALGFHPEIYYNGQENNLIQDLIGVAQKNCTMSSRRKAMVVSQTEYNDVFRDTTNRLIWPDETKQARPVWLAAINPTGDLMPYLAEVFSNSKFISLIRNPLGMIASRMRYDSFQASEFETHCQTWRRSEGVYKWCIANPDRGFILRHEWLYASDLEVRLKRLFDWLGVENDEQPAQYISNTLVHPTETPFEFVSNDQLERERYFESKNDRSRDWSQKQRQTKVNYLTF